MPGDSLNIGPYFQKWKLITQKVCERHQRNFSACIVIIGGIYVPKINNLCENL